MTEHIAQNTGCSEEDARKAALEQLEEDAINFVKDACRVHEYDPSDIEDEEDALEAVDAILAIQEPDEDPQDLLEKYFWLKQRLRRNIESIKQMSGPSL